MLGGGELCGAGIITALRGKQVVPSDVPYHTQQLGLLGSLPSCTRCNDCDTLVLLGTNYPYGQFLPETGQARAIQVDLKPEQMGLRYPTELNLWGDVKATLHALIPLLEQKADPSLAGRRRRRDGRVGERDAKPRRCSTTPTASTRGGSSTS